MATIVLQAAGAFVGGLFGPIGAAIGSAAGALAGYAIDTAIINSTRRIEGPRLSGARPFTAEEGVSLPRVYGAARVGGIMIWATRFEEERTTRRQGGKGGPRITEYNYFGNVAFALCEGSVAGIRRVWADGRELDLTNIEIRLHKGGEAQDPDPLVLAKQGAGNAPGYRGTAYIVIERLPLADFGNRIPQFQFEVLRPVGSLGASIKAVALIPGATEYGLSPGLVSREIREGETEAVNRHVRTAASDLEAALDELQALFPGLENVALVVSWFGDDLRAGNCRIRPGVATLDGDGLSQSWAVSGTNRASAMLVSTHAGGAAYGGTPSDRSVVEAIGAIHARGLGVTLYPFVMMDVPADNALPDPYGGSAQAPYPWRGRITATPAPGLPGTADKTAAARVQAAAFSGVAVAANFAGAGTTVTFSGSPTDWGYRRLVLHYAKLAALAGGVDAFLIGSELRGLTGLRDGAGAFPFVETLCDLAGEARTLLGPATKITYGADWSEYFGHQPADGSGDVLFHLDPLWAHPEINAVGIDNYMPLADWRDADYGGGNPDGFDSPYDPAGLFAAIHSGEGFDWHYPGFEARRLRERAPIEDGGYGKPWVFRPKDLASWWGEPHHDRIGGVESPTPTEWVPGGKPLWFTEIGCPAVDKGANQPNVFPDPKSAESAVPYFSNGGRSDLAQRRFIEAHRRHWDAEADGFEAALNPAATAYGGRMVDWSRAYVWAWDARPFPAFPLRGDRWSDGGNWHYGHWLNGRAEAATAGELIEAILADHGHAAADVEGADGTVAGFVIADPTSARAALEPLCELFGLMAFERAGTLVFRGEGARAAAPLALTDLVSEDREPVVEIVRTPDHELPTEAALAFRDAFADYQTVSVRQQRFGAPGLRQASISFPGVLEPGQGSALLGDWLRRRWVERERATFALPAQQRDAAPGTLVRLTEVSGEREFLVTGIEEGIVRKIFAREIVRGAPVPWVSNAPTQVAVTPQLLGRPLAVFLDLPATGEGPAEDQFRLAAWQRPWKRQLVFASPADSGFELRATISSAADIGVLVEALPPGVCGRFDRSAEIVVELNAGEAASAATALVLNGANAAAVKAANGAWEVLQFAEAEEIEPNVWRLGALLRGQYGTDDATAAGAEAGARLVMLDAAVLPAGLRAAEIALTLNWRVGASGQDLSGANFAASTQVGGIRALTPLAPVHLRASADGGDLAITWVRRSRIGADAWEPEDIPLGEAREEYRVEIAGTGGGIVRTETVSEQAFLYDAAVIAADFPVPPAEIDVTVRQFGAATGWGLPATRRFALP